MKKTQVTDLLTTIKETFVSFMSVMVFVCLGIGMFLGIDWTGRAMQASIDKVAGEHNTNHIEITYPYGLTDSDVQKLMAVEGVDKVDTGYMSIVRLDAGDEEAAIIKLQSLPKTIDTFLSVEGSLPTDPSQIAIDKNWATKRGVGIGDTIRLRHDSSEDAKTDKDGMAYLKSDSMKVTAVVVSPTYLSTNKLAYGISNLESGDVDGIGWLCEDAFDEKKFHDGKPYVLVYSEGLVGMPLNSKEYKEASSALMSRTKELGNTLSEQRYGALHSEAQDKLDDAKKKIDDGESQLKDGRKKLDDAKKQLEDGRKKLDDGKVQLEDGRKQLDDAKKQLEDGKKQLEDGKKQLSDLVAEGEAQLADAKQKLDEGQATYDAKKAELEQGRDRLARAEAAYDDVNNALESGRRMIDDISSEVADLRARRDRGDITEEEFDRALDTLGATLVEGLTSRDVDPPASPIDHTNLEAVLSDSAAAIEGLYDVPFDIEGQTVTLRSAPEIINSLKQQVDEGERQLADGAGELTDAKNRYAAAQQEFEQKRAEGEQKVADAEKQAKEGQEKIDNGEKELKEKTKQLEDGEKEYKEKTKEYEDGEKEYKEKAKELESAKEKYDQGVEQFNALEDSSWILVPRTSNPSVEILDGVIDVTLGLRWTMALLFIVVGLLVCYSAMSRTVYEHTTRLGTKKALGFRSGEVVRLYMLYAGIAVILGAIAGYFLAVFVVENIILSNSRGEFLMDIDLYSSFIDTLFISAIEMVLILASTFLAGRSVLKKPAVELLAGQQPSTKEHFYERMGFWKRISLFAQVTVNNCVNEKRRFFATLVGVAGCTALVVSAITLNNNVMRSYDTQYSEVFDFDTVAYPHDTTEDSFSQIKGALEAEGMTCSITQHRMVAFEPEENCPSSVMVTVPMDGDFDKTYKINPVPEGNTDVNAADTSQGMWLSQSFADHLGLRVGDNVTFADDLGHHCEIPIAGFFEHHLFSHQVVMDKQTYAKSFGVSPQASAALVNTNGKGADSVRQTLKAAETGHVTVDDDKTENAHLFAVFQNMLSVMVVVYLSLAAAMAFCVLLNLDTMFIDEKRRELTVLMICGYSSADAKGYIWHDSVVVTALGILCGVVLGVVTGGASVVSTEPSYASFMHDVSWLAVGIGVAASALLAGIVLVMSLRKIDNFDLTDINRF